MISLEQFVKIVDEAYQKNTSLTLDNSNLVYEEINKLTEGNLNKIQIITLRKTLIYEYIFHGKKILPYFHVVNVIWDSLKNESNNHHEKVDWEKIINIIITNQSKLSFFSQSVEEILNLFSKEVATANAANNLKKIGYSIILSGNKFTLIDSDKEKIEKEIENLCKKIGGMNLFNLIFNNLKPIYDSQLQRYNLVRFTASKPTPPAPQIPWGYLMQLATKYMNEHSSTLPTLLTINQLFYLVTNAIALCEIQFYSIYEGMYIRPESISELLLDVAQYDSIFSVNQLPPKEGCIIYENLLSKINLHGFNNAQIKEITLSIKLCEFLFTISKEDKPSVFSVKEISENLKEKTSVFQHILDKYFSHTVGEINKDMKFPPLSENFGFELRPLMKYGTNYYLAPKSVCSFGIIESLQSVYRKLFNSIGRNFDAELGKLIEYFLITEFISHGIDVKYGEYYRNKSKNKEGECDIIIETEGYVIFIEIKKNLLQEKENL